MNRNEVEALRARGGCAALLESQGFTIDRKQSTRRAVKFRRNDEIIIVIHDDRGWFDARSDAKGDVFALSSHLTGQRFAASLALVADLVGCTPVGDTWNAPAPVSRLSTVVDRWDNRRRPRLASQTMGYLVETRAIPSLIVSVAAAQGILREGPFGSVWAKHGNEAGTVIGWEERGPDWRGFSSGGSKELFRFGPALAPRICITEAAIDAMSLAALEHLRSDTLYVSTGGGWAPRTHTALRRYCESSEVRLVAATDANVQGEVYADRIRQIADAGGCDFSRLRPEAEDWNEELKRKGEGDRLAPVRSAHQG